MKRSSKTGLLLLSFLHQLALFAQKSPVIWVRKSININVDTVINNKIDYPNESISGNAYVSELKYIFQNTGDHVTFIDTSASYTGDNYVTKPKKRATMSLNTHYFLKYSNKNEAISKKRDTTAVLKLPFYYEGNTFMEEITCHFSFGKSKLIKIKNGSFRFDASENIKQLSAINTNVTYTHYFEITNISKKTIFCTAGFEAWFDAPGLRDNYFKYKYVAIPSGKTYKMPVRINAYDRYRFNHQGKIEVFSGDVHEIYNCALFSSYYPGMN